MGEGEAVVQRRREQLLQAQVAVCAGGDGALCHHHPVHFRIVARKFQHQIDEPALGLVRGAQQGVVKAHGAQGAQHLLFTDPRKEGGDDGGVLRRGDDVVVYLCRKRLDAPFFQQKAVELALDLGMGDVAEADLVFDIAVASAV